MKLALLLALASIANASTVAGTLCSATESNVTLEKHDITDGIVSTASQGYTLGVFSRSMANGADGSYWIVTIDCPRLVPKTHTVYRWLIPITSTTLTPAQVSVATDGSVSLKRGYYWDEQAIAWASLAAPLVPGTAQQHSISFTIGNGADAISTGDAGVYPTAAFACTINRIDISGKESGSITVDVWKRAGAIPTSGQKISASAPLTLSSAQLAQNGSLTGWTTAVSSGDVFGFSVATVSTVTRVVGQIWCN